MPRWEKTRSVCLGKAPTTRPDAITLPKDQYNSIDQAVAALEAGIIPCSGYCVAFSERMRAYYLLWPAELPPPPSPGTQAPAPAPTATVGVDLNHDGRANMYVKGVDMNRDGIPDVLQQPQAYVAPTYAAPTATVGVDLNHDGRANMYVQGVDMNRDGIPDALQRPQAYVAPTYAAPTATVGVDLNHDGRANMFVKGVDMNRDGIPDALQATQRGSFVAPGAYYADPRAQRGSVVPRPVAYAPTAAVVPQRASFAAPPLMPGVMPFGSKPFEFVFTPDPNKVPGVAPAPSKPPAVTPGPHEPKPDAPKPAPPKKPAKKVSKKKSAKKGCC